MLKLTLRLARYALTALHAVGFALAFNRWPRDTRKECRPMFRLRRTAVALALAALASLAITLPALAGISTSPGRTSAPFVPFVPVPLP